MRSLLTLLVIFGAVGCATEPINYVPVAGQFARPIGGLMWLVDSRPLRLIEPDGVLLVPDSKIEYDIAAGLVGPFMSGADIQIHVINQNVVLRGTAVAGVQAEAAERRAWQVDGVANVINRIQLP